MNLDGGDDDDKIFSADAAVAGFINYLNGGDDQDLIRGSTGDDDFLLGGDGNDYLYDAGGDDDFFNAGPGDDTMRDFGCDYLAASTGDAGYDLWYPCISAPPSSIESTAPLFTLSCP